MQKRLSTATLGLLLILATGASAPAQYQGALTAPEKMGVGFGGITAERCKEWLSVLASDEFEGRGTGHPGFQKAADFVAARFKEFGLAPGGDNGTYFQMVPFQKTGLVLDKSSIAVDGSDLVIKAGADLDLRNRQRATEFSGTGEVVFIASKGRQARIKDPEVLAGKIVVITTEQGEVTVLTSQANRAGALGVLTVREKLRPPTSDVSYLGEKTIVEGEARKAERVSGSISRAAAESLAKALGVDAKFLSIENAGDGPIMAEAKDKKVTITAAWKSEAIGVPNVLGKLEGADPVLAKEYVICGSHLDHIGVGADGVVNNGADDDGSGSTALLAVARAFATNGVRPKRTLIFIAVCGEEMGLLGSNWYVEHPIYPLADTVCELQMDMVGRNEESVPGENAPGEKAEDNVQTTHLVGSKKLSTELHEIVIDCNKHVGFTFEYDEEDVYTRSDHYNFARKGIPICFFFSGFHRDYHRPTDDVEKINFEKIANTAKLVYTTAFTVADKAERVTVDKKPAKKVQGD